jgi:hypothetical protein
MGLKISWINNWLSVHNINGSGSISGAYYQLTSQLPGQGPCYPAWIPTTDIMNRYGHIQSLMVPLQEHVTGMQCNSVISPLNNAEICTESCWEYA